MVTPKIAYRHMVQAQERSFIFFPPIVKNKQMNKPTQAALQWFIPPYISREVKALAFVFCAWYVSCFLHSLLWFLCRTDVTLTEDRRHLYKVFLNKGDSRLMTPAYSRQLCPLSSFSEGKTPILNFYGRWLPMNERPTDFRIIPKLQTQMKVWEPLPLWATVNDLALLCTLTGDWKLCAGGIRGASFLLQLFHKLWDVAV